MGRLALGRRARLRELHIRAAAAAGVVQAERAHVGRTAKDRVDDDVVHGIVGGDGVGYRRALGMCLKRP